MTHNQIHRNRLGNVNNAFQCAYRRVLCVCSAGMLRSPTLAEILSRPPYNFNTRAVGIVQEFALIPIDMAHVAWAHDIVVFSMEHYEAVESLINEYNENHARGFIMCLDPKIHVFPIEDDYEFRNPILVKELERLCQLNFSSE